MYAPGHRSASKGQEYDGECTELPASLLPGFAVVEGSEKIQVAEETSSPEETSLWSENSLPNLQGSFIDKEFHNQGQTKMLGGLPRSLSCGIKFFTGHMGWGSKRLREQK